MCPPPRDCRHLLSRCNARSIMPLCPIVRAEYEFNTPQPNKYRRPALPSSTNNMRAHSFIENHPCSRLP
eukprot:7961201-Pyramimonas_sp.AAC.1